MKTQLISLSIMFIALVLLMPFPEIDSLRRTFTTGYSYTPVSEVRPAVAIEQRTSSSVDPQEDTWAADETSIVTCASSAETDRAVVIPARSRIIMETGLDEYQMEKHSTGIRETQVSRSNQHSLTPKRNFYATSIHGNTVPTRQNFDFNDFLQKQYHAAQRSNIKQTLFMQQVPASVVESWLLPGNCPDNSPGEQPFTQQLDDGAFRETGQIFNRDHHQRRSVPSLRPERRAAGSLSSGVRASQR